MSEERSRFGEVLGTLGSVKLGAGLMIAIAGASVLGTVILQTSLPGADALTVREHYGRFARPLIALGLTDVFHSTWYAVLLALLAVNVLAATVARFARRVEKIGMLLAHAGILVILAGGLVYSLSGDKGVVRIQEGDAADKYFSRRDGRYRPLPFTLRLDRFTAERYPARLLLVGPKGESLAATPKAGEVLAPSWTSARVTVARVVPGARRVEEVREEPRAPMNPAAKFRVETSEGVLQVWRFARRAGPADTLLASRGRVAVAYDNESTALVNDQPVEPRAYAVNRETGRTVEIPAKAGQSFPLPVADGPAEGEILDVLDDADNTSLGPGLRIQIVADNQTGWRHVFAKFPHFSLEAAAGLPVLLPRIEFVYYRPKVVLSVLRKAGPPESFELRSLADGEWRTRPLVVGEPARAGGTTLTLIEALDRAGIDVRYEPSFARTGVEAVLVRVTWPDGPPRDYWLAAAGADRVLRAAGNLALAFAARDDVREFRSDVALVDNDAAVAATVRVNHPAGFRGWQVFLEQGDSDADPPVCAFVVSRDPGIPLVYAGLALLVLGAFAACFVKKEINTSTETLIYG